MGAVLDGILESIVIGVSMISGGAVSWVRGRCNLPLQPTGRPLECRGNEAASAVQRSYWRNGRPYAGAWVRELSEWAELAIQWAEAVDAELAMLRPKPGQAHIHGDALVTEAGRRYEHEH